MATRAYGGYTGAPSIGGILGQATGVITSNPLAVLGLAFVLSTLPSIAFSLLDGTLLNNPLLGGQSAKVNSTLSLAGQFANIILYGLVQGSLTRAALMHHAGEKVNFSECLKLGASKILPVIATIVLVFVAVIFGFMLLVVPGIILYCMFSVAVPAVVEEDLGVVAALSRSRQLTSGARIKIFTLGFMIGLVVLLVILPFGVIGLMLMPFWQSIPIWVGLSAFVIFSLALSTIFTAYIAAVYASLFIELREWKDGPESNRLADVFA